MARSLVLLSFLQLFVPTAHAEFAVSPPDPGPRPGVKTPHVVKAGDQYAVAWTEASATGAPDRLAAALVDTEGRIVRSFDPVARKQGLPLFPGTIAGSGERVLLPGECTLPAGQRSVCVSWIDIEAGSLSAPQVIEDDAVAPSAAWNGREFLLTYVVGPFTARELRARTISAEGAVGPPIILGRWHPFSHTPSTAADGETFYVAWHRDDGASFLTQIAAGEVRASIPIEAPTQQAGMTPHLAVSAADGEVIVVTAHLSYRIFRNGVATGGWQSIPRSRLDLHHPRAVRNGAGWSIVFAAGAQNARLRAVPVRADGTPGAEVSLNATARTFGAFDAAPSPAGVVLVWSRDTAPVGIGRPVSDVVVAPYSISLLARREPAIVSMGFASQSSPAAAFGGGVYLVVWSERNEAIWQLRAQRFGLGGEAIGPRIDFPFSIDDQIHPAVDFNGESFFVVWSEGPNGRSSVRGARIGADGTLLDRIAIIVAGENPFPLGSAPENVRAPDVSWSGTSWIVASEGPDGIELRRIAPNGMSLDPLPRILPKVSQWSRYDRLPVIECAPGGDCLVAWQVLLYRCPYNVICPPIAPPDTIVAARITSDLTLLDSTPQLLTEPFDGSPRIPGSLAVAWNAMQDAWMVVWSGPSGRRISRSGVLLDPPVSPRAWSGLFVSAAPEGEGWHIVWSSNRENRAGVLSGFVTRSFTFADLHPSLLARPKDGEFEVFAAAGPRPLALFVRAEPELGGAHRVFGRFFDEAESFPTRRRSVRR